MPGISSTDEPSDSDLTMLHVVTLPRPTFDVQHGIVDPAMDGPEDAGKERSQSRA